MSCDASHDLVPLCRFAVPFFTCAAVYFVLQNGVSEKVSLTDYCLQRARRIYVPFLWWSGIYLAARLLKHAVAGFGSPIVFSPAMFLNGTAHHLWFLPFICLATISAYGLIKWFGMPRAGRAHWWALAFVIIGTGFAFVPCPVIIETVEFPISYFIDHAWDALPSVFFGAALFWMVRLMTPGPRLRGAALALGALGIGWEFYFGLHSLAPHVVGAALLFFTATQANRDWMKPLWPWAKLAFVIYLVHVLFVETLQTLATRSGGGHTLPADVSIWALSLIVSGLTAKFISRSRASEWIFPR
jgi:surface polysaccharide O-acyltransferase-like enzyme